MKIMRYDFRSGKQNWKRKSGRKKKRSRKTLPTLAAHGISASTSFRTGQKLSMLVFLSFINIYDAKLVNLHKVQ